MNRDEAILARQQLWNATALLASPSDAQIAWLQKVGTYPLADELVLEFDDSAAVLDQLVSAGLVTEAGAAAVARANDALDQLQQGDTDWSAESLAVSGLWNEVRRAAGMALVELLEPQAVHA